MMLFSESACFSPSVPRRILRLWVGYGGCVARSEQDRNAAAFVFCFGMADPWVGRLLAQPVVVFDAGWIAMSTKEGFRVPMAPYVLDEHCLPALHQEEANVTKKKAYASAGAARRSPKPEPRGAKRARIQRAQSSPEPDPRPMKKARTQAPPEPNLAEPVASNSTAASKALLRTPRATRHLDLTAELSRFHKTRRFSRYSRSSVRSAKLLVILRRLGSTPKMQSKKKT